MNICDRFITDWNKYNLPAIPENADELIRAAVEQEKADYGSFVDVVGSDHLTTYRNAGKQQFAVFGDSAYELVSMYIEDEDNRDNYPRRPWKFAYRPAICGEQVFYSWPDEGSRGMLIWFWNNNSPDEWVLSWMSIGGWLRTSELELSPNEIMDIIEDEADRGLTPITGNNSKPEYQS